MSFRRLVLSSRCTFSITTQDDVEGCREISCFSESQNSSVVANVDGVDSIHGDGEITLVFQDVEPNEAYLHSQCCGYQWKRK